MAQTLRTRRSDWIRGSPDRRRCGATPDVLAVGDAGGALKVLIETDQTVTGCRSCGVVATPHGRRPTLVRDVPSVGRAVLLVWSKRLWRCAGSSVWGPDVVRDQRGDPGAGSP